MIFRDILFFLYPDYFIEADPLSENITSLDWHKLTILDVFLCVIVQLMFYLMATPVSHTIYSKVFARLGNKTSVWSKNILSF